MPICIECRHPVKTLWTQYSGAGDKSSGHNIRLTVCRKCGRFCDKYVEHDFVVIFIDLVLIKPQVCVRDWPGMAGRGGEGPGVDCAEIGRCCRSTGICCTTR
jgi:hypothetical protein